MSQGTDDPLLIEVPKGSYHLAWRFRAGEPVAHPQALTEAPQRTRSGGGGWKWFAAGFAAAAVLASTTIGIWISARPGKIAPMVGAFWQPFLSAPHAPIIVFSNHRFVGTSTTALRYFRDGIDSPSDSNDTYSGTGTVMAVAELSNLLSVTGRSPRLKRAELLTWDEVKDANVVFVGAPDANSRLGELAPLQYFKFKSGHDEPRFGIGGIINLHPAPGEESVYFGPGRPLTSDYAVVALLPNLHPDRKVLILAGTNTYGCQAAAEFLTRSDLLGELSGRLGVAKGGKFPDFEALLKVSVSGGVPMRAEIVVVHRRQTGTVAN